MKKTAEAVDAQKLKVLKRERGAYKAALLRLTTDVDLFLGNLDNVMKSNPLNRGSIIAKLCNGLDVSNDLVRHFTLKQPFPLKKAKISGSTG